MIDSSGRSVLGDVSPGDFLERYWQREPLLVRGAVAGEPVVDGDTLAGLACEDEVESRLVLHERAPETWRCEEGPFPEARFESLPETDWTLLVQGVDRSVPAAAALAARFDFLARWRIDDVMVSYAATGGGVGPHFDHYDVFLVQTEGHRRWRLGQRCDAGTALLGHPELKLLAHFERSAEHLLGPGDLLYVPAGLAHWGEATSTPCITCSVGFRAPSHAELILEAVGRLAQTLPDDRRFRDVATRPPADPWRIDDSVLETLASAWRGLDAEDVEAALASAFGCLVTAPASPELVQADDTRGAPARGDPVRLRHHPQSRLAYRTVAGGAELFVDGEAYSTTAELARGICNGRLPASALDDADARDLLEALLADGSVAVMRLDGGPP